MKKLNKLQINKEKLMKNEELITLRGGYTWHCTVQGLPDLTFSSDCLNDTCAEAECTTWHYPEFGWVYCDCSAV